MAAGSIIIDLLMRTGSFETDTARAEKALKRFQKQAEDFGKKVGIGIAAGVTGAAVAFDLLLKSAGKFKDLEEITGANAEALASFGVAAGTAGTSMDLIASSSVKLTKNLQGVDDESKAAGAALASLGIPLEDFKRLDPAARIEAVAKAMGGFKTSANDSAVATALFGKAGAELLPFLKELEAQGGRQVILTQEQIELADAYADKQGKVRAELQLLAQAAATQALPAFNAFSTAVAETMKSLIGVDTASNKLSKDNGVAEFAEKAARWLAFVVDAAQGVSRFVEAIATGFGAQAAAIGALLSGEFAQAKEIAKAGVADIEAIMQRDLFSTKLGRAIDAQKAEAKQRSVEDRGFDPRAAIAFQGAEKPAAKAKVSESQKYLDTLQKQLEKTKDLSAVEQVLADIQAGRIHFATAAAAGQAIDIAEQIDARKRLESQLKAEAAQMEDFAEANRRIREEGKAVFEATRTPLEKYNNELARQQMLLQEGAIDFDTYTRAISKAGEEFSKKGAGDPIRDALGDSIEAGILDGFRRGSSLSDIFLNELKAQFAKTILRPIIQPVADAGNQLISQLLGAAMASFGGGSGITTGGSPLSQTGAQILGRRAGGGDVHPGGDYLVGENGPERFRPSTSGRIIPNGGFGGMSVIIQNTASDKVSATAQKDDSGRLRVMIQEIVRAENANDLRGGGGPISSGLKARGVNLSGGMPRFA